MPVEDATLLPNPEASLIPATLRISESELLAMLVVKKRVEMDTEFYKQITSNGRDIRASKLMMW